MHVWNPQKLGDKMERWLMKQGYPNVVIRCKQAPSELASAQTAPLQKLCCFSRPTTKQTFACYFFGTEPFNGLFYLQQTNMGKLIRKKVVAIFQTDFTLF